MLVQTSVVSEAEKEWPPKDQQLLRAQGIKKQLLRTGTQVDYCKADSE